MYIFTGGYDIHALMYPTNKNFLLYFTSYIENLKWQLEKNDANFQVSIPDFKSVRKTE